MIDANLDRFIRVALAVVLTSAAVCTENLVSNVLMMQPANQGIRHNASYPLNWARDRRILSKER